METGIKTWFTEGENDPHISVIKIAPTAGYYWDTKHGRAVAGIKSFRNLYHSITPFFVPFIYKNALLNHYDPKYSGEVF